jgi:hypothetical protein
LGEEKLTVFTLKPVKEVIVTELVQEDLEIFLFSCRIGSVSNVIWVDGMIIILILSTPTEKNVERYFEGYRIYEKIIFVKYPKYSKTVKWNGGSFELALKNYKNHPRFVELAKWIKTQSVWNEVREVSK